MGKTVGKMGKITLVIILSTFVAAGASDSATPIHLHLPRSVSIHSSASLLQLGMIGILRNGGNIAGAVSMGRTPRLDERIVIDRATIISRLAASGISPKNVKITGSDEVTVTRDKKIIAAADLIKSAEDFLMLSHTPPPGGKWQLRQGPQPMVVPAADNIELRHELSPDATTGQAPVIVSATANNRKLGERRVLFKLIYPNRRLVAIRVIPASTPISPANTQIRIVATANPNNSNWALPYGKIAKRRILPETVISQNLLKPIEKPLLIKRSQLVLMQIVGDGFKLSATGQALQPASEGDVIRLRNIDTKRTVTAVITADGTAKPLFEQIKKVAQK